MSDQINLCVIGSHISKSAFLPYILIVYLTYTIDSVVAQKLHVFMQSRPVQGRQEHVIHINKCVNLGSCFSNKFLTS